MMFFFGIHIFEKIIQGSQMYKTVMYEVWQNQYMDIFDHRIPWGRDLILKIVNPFSIR